MLTIARTIVAAAGIAAVAVLTAGHSPTAPLRCAEDHSDAGCPTFPHSQPLTWLHFDRPEV